MHHGLKSRHVLLKESVKVIKCYRRTYHFLLSWSPTFLRLLTNNFLSLRRGDPLTQITPRLLKLSIIHEVSCPLLLRLGRHDNAKIADLWLMTYPRQAAHTLVVCVLGGQGRSAPLTCFEL